MAKVKGPLFSLGASGKLADSLVYMNWKGIDDVRQYVIPANPKTADQQTQRGYFTTAVGQWHTDGFTLDDVKAWNLLALALKEALSGFNIYVRLKVNSLIAELAWTKLTNCLISTITSTGATVDIDVASDQTGKLYIGTSKTSMLTEFTGTWSVDKYTFTIIDLNPATNYFFYVKNTIAGEAARTGIYTFKTAVA